MKKQYWLLIVLILCGSIRADFLGIKKASETIVIPVHPPLDSAGLPRTPDSVQVITYADDDISKAYGATGSGYSCAGIDTTSDYGGTHIWFADQIQDIDGDGGHVELAIQIITWVNDLPTYTMASVQVVSDSLENFLDAAKDSSASSANFAGECLDSLQAQDDWVGNFRYASSDSILKLRGLHIRGTVSGDTGLVAVGYGDGPGAYIGGGTGNSNGVYARGFGTGNGLLVQADSTGHGIRAQGGQISGDGFLAEARGGATASYGIRGNGQGTGSGIYGYGGSSGSGLQGIGGANGHGAFFRGGSVAGHGLLSEASAGDSCGIVARKHGNGEDFQFSLNLDNLMGTLDAGEIGTGAIGSDQLAVSAADKVANEIFDEDTASHNVAGSYGVLWKDTTAYQGSAASLDSGVVQRIVNRGLDSSQTAAVVTGTIDSIGNGGVDAIWNELQSGHQQAGTFGYYLDAAVSSIEAPAGNGSYPFTITVMDSSIQQVVPGARISVHNLDLTALMAIGSSSICGTVDFNLDSGKYILATTAPGYLFNVYDTIVVSGSGVDSVSGYSFDPGVPIADDLCRVYGFIYGIDGQAIEGVAVTAALPEGVARYGTAIISPYRVSTATDSTGYFYLDLIPSNSLIPSQTEYLVTAIYPSGTVLKKRVLVPDAENWLLVW